MRFNFVLPSLFFISAISLPSFADVEFDYEIDPYYSNVGLYLPFNNESVPMVALTNEREIYLALLKEAFTPSFFVLELSVNPLPVLGVYLKEQQNSLYQDLQVTNDLNLVEAITEGFEEPYALSFFLGNVIKFTLPNETEAKSINKGFSGFLISIGDQHIRSNIQFKDQWTELEWKLKGDRRIGDHYHSFSFRIGTKTHSHKNIESSYYFGMRRAFFNSKVQKYDLLDNIGIDFRVDFSRKTNRIIQSELFIDKKWPTDSAEISFGIGVQRVKNKYLNDLSDLNQGLQLILRPSIKF